MMVNTGFQEGSLIYFNDQIGRGRTEVELFSASPLVCVSMRCPRLLIMSAENSEWLMHSLDSLKETRYVDRRNQTCAPGMASVHGGESSK